MEKEINERSKKIGVSIISVVITISFLLMFVYAIPLINFVSPTAENGSYSQNNSFIINVSIIENSLENLTYNFNGTNFTIYNNSLIFFMNFDNVSDLGEGNSLNRTVDISSRNITSNCSNMPSGCNYSAGKYGNAIGFDGVDDFVLTNVPKPSLPFTICFWINPNSANPVGIFDSAPGLADVLRNYNSGYVEWWNQNPNITMGLSAGVWTHLCFEYSHDGTNRIINWTKNGVKQTPGSAAGTSNFAWTTFRIGDINNGASGRFAGYLDNFMIWNRSLNTAEIYQLYISNLQKFNATQWYFYANQSKNLTSLLDNATYNYQLFAANSSGSVNQTDLRYIIFGSNPNYINFISPTPSNGTTTSNSSFIVNVSITQENLNSLIYNFNNTNYTMYNDSLILMMNFDNLSALGENSTYAVDVSKYGNNGTSTGATWNSSGKYLGAYTFNKANNNYIDLGSSNSIDLEDGNQPKTISFWFNPALLETNWNVILAKDKHNSGYEGYIYITNNGLCATNDGPCTGPTFISTNQWNHGTIIANATTVKIYVNGRLINQTAESAFKFYPDENMEIGARNNNGGGCCSDYFNGSIDEVRVWNRSLSDSEVYEQYVSNLQKFSSTQWYLYVNQSKNATTRLDNGNYNYQIFTYDSAENKNQTEQRTITIQTEIITPQISFINSTPSNTSYVGGSFIVNVSIGDSNLNEVKYNWNGTNFTIYNNSLVLMMNFDNLSAFGENATYAVDVSKYGNNGTLGNGTVSTNPIWNSSGKYGGAYQFDGINDFVNISALNYTTNSITIIAWIKGNYTGSYTGIIYSRDPVQAWGIHYRDTSGQLAYTWNNNSGSTWGWVSGLSPNPNVWTFVALTINSSQARIYMSNSSGLYFANNTIAHSVQTLGTAINIGQDTLGGRFYNGSIDEVRIWNRSLNAEEIYELYISNLQKFNSTQWYLYINQSRNSTNKLVTTNYSYFVSAKDLNGNENITEKRFVSADSTNPSANLSTPLNNTLSNNLSYNFTLNISDNVGISNVTLNIINSTNSTINQTSVSLAEGTLTSTIGIVVSLVQGVYKWFYQVTDIFGNVNVTSNYTITIDTGYPIFSNYMDNNATLVGSGIAIFNATVLNTNGTVWIEINGFNYSSRNISANIYNYSLNLVNATYVYRWWAYGNGSNKNINSSELRYFTVNNTHPSPIISISTIYPTENINITQNTFFNFSVNVSCTMWDCGAINVTLDPSSSTIYNFTTCGIEIGRFGPNQTQCNSNYSNSSLNGLVSVYNGTQNFTISRSGSYRIEAWGSVGGQGSDSLTGPGKGAYISGEFALQQGTILKIVVGQKSNISGGGGKGYGTGGGGGSFVVLGNNTPLIIAGGGGGSSSGQNYRYWGMNGSSNTSGTNANTGYAGGNNGNGGTGSGASWGGQGGAGFNGTGGSGYGNIFNAQSFLNGSYGGSAYSPDGGFGGGGAGGGGAGGGGGYSGGGGAYDYQSGGGGGSYNSGTNQVNLSGINNFTGKVSITYLGVVKSGAVSMNTSETPFYTNVTNPYNISLDVNQSQVITWWVNATGPPITPFEFFVYGNMTTNLSIGGSSSKLNITISDIIPPEANITYPINKTYNYDVVTLNYTYYDYNGAGYCWYSNSSGEWNSSAVVSGINFTNVSTSDGNNNFILYCNDSSGNVNSSIVIFTKRIPRILLDWIYPTENINVTQLEFFNITVNVSCINGDCEDLNVTLDPLSNPASCKQILDAGLSTGNGTYTIYPFGNITGISVYCDMSTDGGGWTLVFGGRGSTATYSSTWAGWFSNGSTTNLSSKSIEGKSEAYDYLNVTSIMLETNYSTGGRIIANFTREYDSLVSFIGPNPGGNNGNTTWNNGLKGNITAYNRTGGYFLNNYIAFWVGDGSSDTEDRVVFATGNFNNGDWSGSVDNGGAIGGEFRTAASTSSFFYVYVRENTTVTSGKGGVISMDVNVTPFYTNVTNPYSLTLNEGESQVITWWVNATGRTPNSPYEFFVYANITNNASINNITSKLNITILDLVAPVINITYPQNTTYSVNVSTINYDYSDYSTGGTCWYSNNSGIWNSSIISAGTSFSNVLSFDGGNNFILWCNDSSGNNADSVNVSFFRDIIYPRFSNYWDNNGTMNGSGISIFNVTINNTNGTVLLEINGTNYSANNISSNVWNYSLLLSNSTYAYRWISYGNGTLNNLNVSNSRNYTIFNNLNIINFSSINETGIVDGTVSQGRNVTINASIDNAVTVLLKIWRTFIGGQILWQGFMNNVVGNLWSITVQTNITWPTGPVNYTIYANDSIRVQFNQSGNFSILDTRVPDIFLKSPLNFSYVNIPIQYFAANFSENVLLVNATIYIWNSTNSTINITSIDISNSVNITNISILLPYDDVFRWNYYSCDNSSNCGWNNTNWSLTYDSIPPAVNITNLINTTYNINVSVINYSYYDINPNASCWMSNSSGAWNSTRINATTNTTNFISVEGQNIWTIYCNDSANNVNSSSVTFIKDTPRILIERIYPLSDINTTLYQFFNITVNVSCIEANCGEINVTLDPAANTNYTFTNCNISGRTGPNQTNCNNAYNGTSLASAVNVNSGIQNWTVPATGNYIIDVYGAQGGIGTSSYSGGLGARMRGTFYLTAGTVLKILVGQSGGNSTSYKAGGGGGGSFVTYANNTPLIIAGGGGGGGGNQNPSNGQSGLNTSNGGNGSYSNTYAGGINGNGGRTGSGTSGGGGLIGNGNTSSSYPSYSQGPGMSFVNNGTGGLGATCAAGGGYGGFGGGSGGEWCNMGSTGAGGGYSGGGGTENYGVAGGGGSYNSGTNATNLSGNKTGNGLVIITLIGNSKGGTVSTNSSETPFYTNVTNPYNLTLNEGESAVITWFVNTTGNPDNYTFFVYVNKTAELGYSNITSTWNVTILNITLDLTAPVINLTSPQNGTGSTSATQYFAANFSDLVLLSNATLYIWNSTNSTIYTTSNNITGTLNSTNISVTLPYENKFKWNYYSCDNSSNCGFATNNLTAIYDTVPPYFISFSNISIYNNQSLNSSINASDNIQFNNFAINWSSNFTINKTFGVLSNSSILSIGIYYINITINDSANNLNSTIISVNVINSTDSIYPQFSNYWDNNASIVSGETALFNVTVTNTNGTVKLNINGTNYLASNLTSNDYNVSVRGLLNATYIYNWSAYGNGTVRNINLSNNRYYAVNASPPPAEVDLNWIYPATNINVTQFNFFNITLNVTCLYRNCSQINITLDPAVGYGTASPYNSGTSANSCKESGAQGTIDSCNDGSTCSYPFKIENIYIVDMNNSEFTAGDTINVTLTTNTGCCSPDVAWAYSNNTVGGSNFRNMGYTADIASGVRNYSKTFVLDNVAGNHTIRGINIYNSASSTLLCGSSQSYGSSYSDTDDVIIYVKASSTKNGIVSMNTSAIPFYTNVTNPNYITLNVNQSQTITWWLNATGLSKTPYAFFIYGNLTSNSSIGNLTSRLNITILDVTAPTINITYPQNTTYGINITVLNYSYYDYNGNGYCWYSNNSGVWNSSIVVSKTNFTNLACSQDNCNIILYCNDSSGNINSANVSYSKIAPSLTITMINPTGNITVNKSYWFNVSVNISCANNDCGTVNVSLDPEIYPSQCTNYTTINWDNYNTNTGASSACSNTLASKWYRLNGTYNEIAEQRDYVTGICGTSSPGFLNFSHPTNPGASATGAICYHWEGNTCKWKSSGVNATKCSSYYVYYITSSPACALQACTTDNISDPVPAYTKSGLVPKNSGIPFYTNVDNPYAVVLNAGESQVITWWVNATGTVDASYPFFVYANSTNYSSLTAMSDKWNVTIQNGTSAAVDLTYPIFSNYQDNGPLTGLGRGYFNVTLNNTNGTVWLTINNTNVTAVYMSSNKYNASYNFTGNGSYSYRWWAYGSGNSTLRNYSNIRTFNISFSDTTAPILSIVYPLNTTYRTIVINFTIRLNENASWCGYSLDGGTNISLNPYNTTYFNSTNSSMTQGNHIVIYSCNDTGGNFNYTSRSFSIDSIAPDISFSSPVNASYTTKNISIIITNNSDARNIWYNRGLGNETYGSAVWKTFSEGANIISGYANDSMGNINSTTVSFLVDSMPPTITAVSPVEKTYTTSNIVFNISTNENSYCWFSLNSTNNYTLQTSDNRTFDYSLVLDSNTYSINYYCNDSLNNLATKQIIFGVDVIPPQISLNSPALNQYYKNATVQFNYTPLASDGLSSCELWGNWTGIWHKNDSTTLLENDSTNYFIKTLDDGIYIWNVWCNNTNNQNDWSTQGNISFIIDRTPPQISFVSPINISYNSSIVSIEITNNSDSSSVWWSNGTTNTSYSSAADINLADGTYTYFAYANDSAGNINETNVTFYVDTNYSYFSDFASNNASLIGTGTGLFNVTIWNTNGSVWLNINGIQINATYLSENIYYANYSFSLNETYVYNWTSYSNGTSHLIATSANQYYTINNSDTTSPNATLLAPENNSPVNYTAVNFTANLTDITPEEGDTEIGIKNVTLNIYNYSDSLINQTTVTYSQGTLTSTVGVVVTLVNGVYKWFYSLFDYSGNRFTTGNRTLHVDVIPPAIEIITNVNNSLINNNPLIVTLSVSDTYLSSCFYYDEGYSGNVTLDNCSAAVIPNVMEGEHNLTFYANDSAGNVNSSKIVFTMDATAPEVSLDSPADIYSNDSSYEVNVTFNCSATDNKNLSSISLYITNNLNKEFLINQSTNVTGTSNSSGWTLSLWYGNYTWSCLSYDSVGNANFALNNYSLLLNFSDADNDLIADVSDNLWGNEENVNKTGIANLNITIDNINSTYGTYNDTHEIAFFDSTDKIMNFTFNFSASVLDLNKITIIKSNNSVIVNVSGQLQMGYNKIIYIEDNNFVDLCVKDSEVSNISQVSVYCNETDETNFSSCIGDSSGITIGYVTCADEGSKIRIENLLHSAIRGTVLPNETEEETPAASDSGSSGGGGGGSVKKSNKTKEIGIKCSEDADCPANNYCFENKCYVRECINNSQCNGGKSCWNYRCVKLFDIKILDIDSSVGPGNYISFSYFLKGMANISNDVVIDFWIEKDGKRITFGKDTIFIGNMEEKTEKAKLFIPKDTLVGEYNLHVSVTYEKYSAESNRQIEIDKDGNVFFSLNNPFVYIIPLLIIIILLLSIIVIKLERKRIKNFFEYQEEWILTHKLFITLLCLCIIFIMIIALLGIISLISLPELNDYLDLGKSILEYLFTPQISILVGMIVAIIIALLIITHKRKAHRRAHGLALKRKNYLEHHLKKIRHRIIQRKIHRKIKMLEKKGYDVDLIKRNNSQKEKIDEWRKKGYDVDSLKR